MAFDDIVVEIERLMGNMEKRPEDRHELYIELRGKLNEIRTMGMPVPDDLAQFERELEAEFAADRKGRATSAPQRPPKNGRP